MEPMKISNFELYDIVRGGKKHYIRTVNIFMDPVYDTSDIHHKRQTDKYEK